MDPNGESLFSERQLLWWNVAWVRPGSEQESRGVNRFFYRFFAL